MKTLLLLLSIIVLASCKSSLTVPCEKNCDECWDGQCIMLCEFRPRCDNGYICIRGRCVVAPSTEKPDLCKYRKCGILQVCIDGKCIDIE